MNNINYENLNKMIKYIEVNIENDINMNQLAKIVGISENSLQRIFTFMTGISISEYIKKRRLSKAFEEIKTTNAKILDIALKYKYNSNISFDRSFKKLFGITPIECRNNQVSHKQFPIITFSKEEKNNLLNYEIKYLEENEIFYYKTETKNEIDLLYKIRQLYNYLKEKGIHEKLKKEEQYALSYYKDGVNYYIVGSKTKYTSKLKLKIPSGKYAIFEVGTREQKDIVELEKKIYTNWLQSTNYNINEEFSLEYYKGDNCYLCIPLVA